MPSLDLMPRVARPDDFYDMLIVAHEGLTHEESMRLNARLVFVLANQVGDFDSLQNAVAVARLAVPKNTDH